MCACACLLSQSFMKPFSVQVWVAILLTMIATPTVIVVAENLIVVSE